MMPDKEPTLQELGLEHLVSKPSGKKPRLSTDELQCRLDAKYPRPSWLMLWEVRDATGRGSCRSADAMAFGVWPSRGLSIIGFEIKSSRSDWLTELKTPQKAESIARFCDEWWLVTGDDVARIEEIPKTWGWLSPKGRSLTVSKAAVENSQPQPSRDLLMSIVRKFTETYMPRADVTKQVREEAERLARSRYDERGHELSRLRVLAANVRAFSDASGINIDGGDWPWRSHDWKEVGQVVHAVLDNSLTYKVDQAREVAEAIDNAMEKLLALPLFAEVKKESDTRRRKRVKQMSDARDATIVRLKERASLAAAKLREMGYNGEEATAPII